MHEFDEYFIVTQGEYTLIIDGNRNPIKAGDEFYIPKGTPHAGEFIAGTRTIHAFGGKRENVENFVNNAWGSGFTLLLLA